MSYVAGAFALLSLYQGYQGAKSQKAGFLAQADEFDLMAYETDLTRKFNWQQRNAQTKQIKLKTLQSGLDKAAMAGVQGLKTVENIRAQIGGSGVALGGGTAQEIVMNQHLQNANTQLAIMQGTNERLDMIQSNAIAVNKMADWEANMKIKGFRRKAANARSSASAAYTAGLFSAFTSAASTYSSTGGEWSMKGFEDDPNSGWYDTWGMNSSPSKPKLNKLTFSGSAPKQPSHWKWDKHGLQWDLNGEPAWEQGYRHNQETGWLNDLSNWWK